MTWFPGGLSPWPSNYLLVQMYIDGSWVSMTLDELSEDGIQISRGGKSGSLDQDPGSLTFSLKDPTGKWSPRHPASPYYGKIGRGTKVRVRVRSHATGSYFDRFYGEIVSFTPVWTRKGQPSARVDVEASGVLRRLGQGNALARSPYRRQTEGQTGIVAYWPLEDPDGVTEYASAGNADPMVQLAAGIDLAQSSSLQGSDPLPEINGGSAKGSVPNYTATTTLQLRGIFKNSSATPAGTVFARYIFSGGSLGYIDLIYTSATLITVSAYRVDGTLIGSFATSFSLGANIYFHELDLTQSGGTLNATEIALNYTTNSTGTNTGLTWASTTMGKVRSIIINPNTAALGNSIAGHLTAATTINSYGSPIYASMNGHNAESALTRIGRLVGELGVSFIWDNGPWANPRTENMGYQRSGVLLDLIQECVDVDMGILREGTTEAYELFYVTQGSMFSNKTNVSTFTYVENMFSPFVPVEDDQDIRNQVTVTRNVGGGGEKTSVQAVGPLGTDTVGLYDDSISLNLDSPLSVRGQADWRVHLGTWDAARWPQIGIDLADYRIVGQGPIQSAVLSRDIGHRIKIIDIPDWLPPYDVDQIITGISETVTSDSHVVIWNCIPAGPYRVGHWSESTDRYSGEGTTAPALTTTQTSFTVVPPNGTAWTHADGDYDILIGGERMTVKNVVGNVFTVVRSVNGIVKAHTAGGAVTLYDQTFWGL